MFFLQDDPHNQGYQRVHTTEGTLSASATTTTLDTIVLDTNTEDLLSLGNQGTSEHKTNRGGEKETNPFVEEAKRNLPHKSALKDSRVSFTDLDDEATDTIDNDFLTKRAHFQKFKSNSSATKRLLLNVSNINGD